MRAYQDMVYGTAFRLLGNGAEAEDVAQEVFLKAYERFEELSQSATAGGWLKTVTRNLCLNHLTRYRARWRFFSDMFSGEEEGDYAADLPAPGSMEHDIDAGERRRVVEEALQKLPANQRVPLVLFHFEGLPYEEIAVQMNVSLGKVKTDIHRGREALARKLKLTFAAEVDGGAWLAGTAGTRPATTLPPDR